MIQKTCKRCGQEKPVDAFASYGRSKDGLDYWCRICHNTHNNERRRRGWDKVLDDCKTYKLKAKYDLTREQYTDMLEAQEYKCAICQSEIVPFTKQTHVDHNHETNKVRGLLCNKCNMGLGMFNDSWQLLSQVMNYLERNDDPDL